MFQKRGRDKGNIADRRAPEGCHYGTAGLIRRRHLAPKPAKIILGNRPEFLQVVRRVELRFVNRLLADNRIEEEPARRHVAAGGGGRVSFRIDRQPAFRVLGDVELSRHKDLLPPRHPHLLPVISGKAEHRVAWRNADGVDSQDFAQVVVDRTEHLIGFPDANEPFLQPIVVS